MPVPGGEFPVISSCADIVRMEYIYGLQSKKYLHIYDWNYWWGYYRCGKDCEPFHGADAMKCTVSFTRDSLLKSS